MRRPFIVLFLFVLVLALVPAPAQGESSPVRSFSRFSLADTTIDLAGGHEHVTLSGESHLRLAVVSAPTEPCRLQAAFRGAGAERYEFIITGVDHVTFPGDPCRDLGTLVRTTTVFQLLPPNPIGPPNPVIPSPPPIRLTVTYTAVPNEATGDPVLTQVTIGEPVT